MRKFVEPLGGTVAAEFFDVGQSRSVPWERREHAALLLAELKRPGRGWSAVVVGEGIRCWFGNQFSLIAPRLAAYGVDLWVPELGGQEMVIERKVSIKFSQKPGAFQAGPASRLMRRLVG